MKNKLTPKEVKRLGTEGIQLTWSDGQVHKITSRTLRENCPSADSRVKRGDTSHDRPLGPKPGPLKILESSLDEELELKRIWGVGNYALGMEWGDGHSTGIYPYDLLYELGSKQKPAS